jgi:glycosyltransferase involved in cell wall biosynthesis
VRILTFGTLYPDATRPQHGIFVEHRLRHLLALGGTDARVVAPVPWFPSAHPAFGAWGGFARVAPMELRGGVEVRHPRFPVIPKAGMTLAPALLALGARATLARLRAEGFDFDVIDAQYFYPDGVAAVLLGRHFGRPVTITARGSDLNVVARYRLPRRMILGAARRAAGLVTVCDALKATLVGMGVPAGAVRVLRNGVDLDLFRPPADRVASRRRLGVEGPTLLAVGNLVPLKGHDLVLRALAALPDVRFAIAGAGPEAGPLRRLAGELGLEPRVRFLGRVDQAELAGWYGAADALVLASESEGMANVLLESMACGTPVVATAVGGTPEVVDAPAAGELIAARTPDGIAAAVRRLLARDTDRAATRRHAERFSWAETARGLQALFAEVAGRPRR